MVRLLLALALLCTTAHTTAQTTAPAPGAAGAERTTAGKVELTEGDVRFLDPSRKVRRPAVGDVVYEGDSIATGSNGEVHLRMEDSGYIAVRPGTRIRIVNFRAQGDAEDRSIIALLDGSFRSVTGWIAKAGRDRAIVRTQTATIGIRGTEHEPLVIPEGSKLGEPGTYDRVHAGETEIRTKQGTVSVRPNQAGFVPQRGAQRPRVLERVPVFFRPTRNEARFTGLHNRVGQQLEQRRQERRQFVEQRRKNDAGRPNEGKGAKGKGDDKSKQPGQRRDEKRAEQEKKQRSADERQAERRQTREEQKRKTDEQKRERQERERKADDRKRERQEQQRRSERQEQQQKGDKRGKGDK